MIEREPAFKWVLRKELDRIKKSVQNPVLMDIGANEGDYTVLMHEFFDGVPHQIIAIEADANNFERLVANMKFHCVTGQPLHCAIGEIEGPVEFYGADKNNLGSLIHRSGVTKYQVTVQGMTIKDLPRADFIKMDIEGGEVLTLRGARDFLKNGSSPSILMETHQLQYTKNLNLEEELKFLFDSGWTCKYMISTALPDFYSGYKECLPVRSFEVKPGWKRIIFYTPANEDVIRYACWPDKFGVPTWHGTLSGKLIRALLLTR